jgi:hypothetical protein
LPQVGFGAQYYPPSCALTCTLDINLYTVLSILPSVSSGNRVQQWAEVMLNGVRGRRCRRGGGVRGSAGSGGAAFGAGRGGGGGGRDSRAAPASRPVVIMLCGLSALWLKGNSVQLRVGRTTARAPFPAAAARPARPSPRG